MSSVDLMETDELKNSIQLWIKFLGGQILSKMIYLKKASQQVKISVASKIKSERWTFKLRVFASRNSEINFIVPF